MSSMVTDPRKIASEILFGSRMQPVSGKELSRVTGISESSISNYRQDPAKIPLERFCKIAAARKLDGEELQKLVKAYGRLRWTEEKKPRGSTRHRA